MSFHVRYVSDIHLEMRKKIDINKVFGPPHEDDANTITVLAGDIGNPFTELYSKFLQQCADRFLHVLVIAGNHEYYTSKRKRRTMQEIDTKLDEYCNTKVTVLTPERSIVFTDEHNRSLQFIGCTLWTISDQTAEYKMNDYRNIYVYDNSAHYNTRLLKYHDILYGKYLPHRTYLGEAINSAKIPTVVVTHHAPSFRMLGKDKDEFSTLYATDLHHLIKPPVVAWISGHTHSSTQIEINGIISVSNCMGYPNQSPKKTGHNPHAKVSFR